MTKAQKTLVSLAGPATNLVFAVVLLAVTRLFFDASHARVLGRGGVPGVPPGDRVRAEHAAGPRT